jgi:type I restriction enzyme, S subunit
MIPEGWKVGFISDLVKSLDAGVSVNSEDRLIQLNEVGVLKVSAVSYGTFQSKEHKVVLPEERQRLTVYPKRDRILISRANTPIFVGASVYIDRDYPEVFLPDKLWQTEPCHNNFSMRWLSYLITSDQYRTKISDIATGTSSSMKNISKVDFLNIQIEIPPLEEQRKIAEILSTWDRAIELLEQLIAMKRKLKQGLMQQLLTGKRRFKEFEGSEWKFTKIEDIAEINPRKHPKDLQFLGEFVEMASVSESGQLKRIAYVELLGVTTGYTPFINDDTLIAKITPCFENGKGAFVKGLQGLGLGSTEFHVLRSRQEVLPKYLYYLTRTHGFKLRGTASMQGSGGQQRVPTDFVSSYKVKIPPFHEQQKIVDVLYSADAEIETLEKQLSAYKQQKRGLMQQLLTGKKRVASPPSTVFDSGRPLSNYVERGENLA